MTQITSDDEDLIENNEMGSKSQQIEQITMSIYPVSKISDETLKIYSVEIRQSKKEIDMSVLQNQYYQMKIFQKGSQFGETVQRRFSDFALLYKLLFRSNTGYIFPAFPENGLFAYMKTKVSVVKDERFVAQRIRVIQRFLTEILNTQRFNPEKNNEIKAFISDAKYNTLKKVEQEKNSESSGFFGLSWNKLKSCLPIGKDTKYKDIELGLAQKKKEFQLLYEKVRQLVGLLKQELAQDDQLLKKEFPFDGFGIYKEKISYYNDNQRHNLHMIQKLEFALFCENEDILMGKKVIDYIEQLKQSQDNNKELRKIEDLFNKQVNRLLKEKEISQQKCRQKYQKILLEISLDGRIN